MNQSWDTTSVVNKEKVKKEKLCVSHSKVGVIIWQGGIQQNGSRAGKLQVIQDGELRKAFCFTGINELKENSERQQL